MAEAEHPFDAPKHKLRWHKYRLRTMLRLISCAVFTACSCIASGKEDSPEIAITLEQPTADFIFGQPIPLTVVLRNCSKQDLYIKGFNPEGGMEGWYDCIKGRGNLIDAFTTVEADTEVEVKRLSGKPNPKREFGGGPGVEREPLHLEPGASQKYYFDLTDALILSDRIDSPRRFRVGLLFRVETKESVNWKRDPREWHGEARTPAIEINVIGKEATEKRADTPSAAKSARTTPAP